ncbi:MAG TPA: nickel pincer cofactor biosynthesis protein LarC [Nitrospirales bacterium]|nr:nickel pincer cofactor biosynthesis protein LarC [Nitrospirales bacterium]
MKTAYFECSSGISGDMILGALVDAGLPLAKLSAGLKCLPIKGFSLKAKKVHRSTIAATKVDVIIQGTPTAPRTLKAMVGMINKASLPLSVAKQSIEVLSRMAHAEARAHGIIAEKVVFHEIGVVDTIVDVVGGLLGCAILGIEQVTASPLNLGSGLVKTSHGTLPIPAPATAQLLKGVPIYTSEIQAELTTPTGAALVTSIATDFGSMPEIRVQSIGHGAGTWQIPGHPNLLRIFIGEGESTTKANNCAVMIETNLDDMNPQIYDLLIERLLHAGALDVTLTPVIMKQGRPGIILGALTTQNHVDAVTELIFRETTALGVRFHDVARTILARIETTVKTKYGSVAVKIATLNDGTQRRSPEYRDCRRIAQQTGTPVRDVMDEVRRTMDRAQRTSASKGNRKKHG